MAMVQMSRREPRARGLIAWARFMDAAGRLLVRLIWVAVLGVILATVGKYTLLRSHKVEAPVPAKTTQAVARPVAWGEVDGAVAAALKQAHSDTERYASQRLDLWLQPLIARIDEDFLPWYFGYLNQQMLGLKGLYQSVVHWVDGDAPTAAQRITAEVQEEFARRVLRPEIAQMELERITQDVVEHYVQELRRSLSGIPERYDIPKAQWDRYLQDIAVVTSDVEGNRSTDLSLKALVVGSGAGGAVVLGKSLQIATAKLGTKVSAELAGKAAGGMAAETGAKVAAKAGSKLLGPIIGVGIIVWDAWDHYHTREQYEPILRKNLIDYLNEVKTSLLTDSETGVMSVVYRLQANIVESMEGRQPG
jgi:hypothetical protein